MDIISAWRHPALENVDFSEGLPPQRQEANVFIQVKYNRKYVVGPTAPVRPVDCKSE